MRSLVLAMLAAAGLSGCAVVSVASAVVSTTVTVASVAVDVGVAAGKGAVHVGKAIASSGDDDEETKQAEKAASEE